MTWAPGIVLTAAANRLENLQRTLPLVEAAAKSHGAEIVCVLDGEEAWPLANALFTAAPATAFVFAQKHRPGMEQPRNLGVRALGGDAKQVWFVDSDLIFNSDILQALKHAWDAGPPRVLIGPYDWGAPGVTTLGGRLEQSDPRNAAFELYSQADVIDSKSSRGEIIGAALACFGGNLVWPRDLFEELGGFHPELSHGRVEDGELGLRASEAGVPMSYVAAARALHVWHPRNEKWILETNAREVPLLNQWHPWVQQDGLRVVPEDGLRFNFLCPECGESVNTGLYWGHYQECANGG